VLCHWLRGSILFFFISQSHCEAYLLFVESCISDEASGTGHQSAC